MFSRWLEKDGLSHGRAFIFIKWALAHRLGWHELLIMRLVRLGDLLVWIIDELDIV